MPGSCVLIVEDEEAIRETLRLALELEGFRVESASNGLEALEMLRKIGRPCVILLDLMMPVMDGWAFADALERNLAFSTIPVVVVTAFSERGKTIHARKVVKKPIDLDLLSRTVREFCVEERR